ncbi:hypothetical protein FA95DRAFT_1209424 [Auriscalpium vulgare]|uniref:Uncharacterized protein n=1 Tax=Auriscalpium vulgare TaxID=40419 RepID=A0ACB8RVQ9_9AGAM|nr:hypothetical protein FA95DRAFT_1209424 [Auriscalpium vulgare]
MLDTILLDPLSDPEFLEIERTLRRNPAQVLQRAKDGSVLAVQAISLSSYQMRTREVFDIFCSHVAASKIPRPFEDPSPSDISSIGCAFWSFSAISALTDVLDMPSKRPLIAQIAAAWDGIYQWTAFFDELSPRLTPKQQKCVSLTIAPTVFIILHNQPSRERVLQTPGILELAASLWVKEPKITSPEDTIGQSTGLVWLTLTKADDATLARFVDAAGGLPARVARAALSHLRAVLKDPEGPIVTVRPHLQVLLKLVGGTSSTLRSAIVNQCGVAVVTQAVVVLASRRDHARSNETRQLVHMAFHILSVITVTGNSVRWLCSALDEGLLRAYAALLPEFNHYDTPKLRQITYLLDLLPAYLVYKGVVTAVVRSLHALNMDVASKRIKGNALKKAWLRLESRAKAHAVIKDRWDAEKFTYCHNCWDTTTTLKQCARCKQSLYCSKSCQTARWTEHKTICSIRSQLSLRANFPTKGDCVFLQRLALHDARQELATLCSEVAEGFPSTLLSKIGIVINYNLASPSPYLSVFSVENYNVLEEIVPTEDRVAEDGMDGIVEFARATEESVTLFKCVTTLGEKAIISLVLVAPSIWNAPEDLGELDFEVLDSEMAEML